MSTREAATSRPTGFLRTASLADGTEVWRAQVRTTDGTRRQRTLGRVWRKRSAPPAGYLTEGQAKARLQAILAGDDATVPVAARRDPGVTLKFAARAWIRWKEESKCRPSTLQDCRAELGHLYAEFGENAPLASITVERIEAWKRRAIAGGRLSDRTINKRLQQLGAIFRHAKRAYGHPSNAAADVDRQPERRSGDFDVLDPGEVELLAANAASEQDAATFTVAAFTGLRLGELLAIRWGDIDWTLHLVHVRRSFTRGKEGPPKSGRVRSVPLVDQAAAALDGLSRREQWTGDDDLVFVYAVGDHVERSTLRRRFVAALERAGLKRIRLHDLRHTFGTLAVQAFPLTDVKAVHGTRGHRDDDDLRPPRASARRGQPAHRAAARAHGGRRSVHRGCIAARAQAGGRVRTGPSAEVFPPQNPSANFASSDIIFGARVSRSPVTFGERLEHAQCRRARERP